MGHQAAKFFTNQTDQSTLNFNDEQPPSLDPVEQEVAKIINGRRRTIGPANESPEYRLKTSAVSFFLKMFKVAIKHYFLCLVGLTGPKTSAKAQIEFGKIEQSNSKLESIPFA